MGPVGLADTDAVSLRSGHGGPAPDLHPTDETAVGDAVAEAVPETPTGPLVRLTGLRVLERVVAPSGFPSFGPSRRPAASASTTFYRTNIVDHDPQTTPRCPETGVGVRRTTTVVEHRPVLNTYRASNSQ